MPWLIYHLCYRLLAVGYLKINPYLWAFSISHLKAFVFSTQDWHNWSLQPGQPHARLSRVWNRSSRQFLSFFSWFPGIHVLSDFVIIQPFLSSSVPVCRLNPYNSSGFTSAILNKFFKVIYGLESNFRTRPGLTGQKNNHPESDYRYSLISTASHRWFCSLFSIRIVDILFSVPSVPLTFLSSVSASPASTLWLSAVSSDSTVSTA